MNIGALLPLLLLKLSGFAIVLFLFWLIRWVLVRKSSFTDFIIGDSGTYSLSRLQVVAWVYVIISFQVTALIATLTHSLNSVYNFNLVLPEEILFLLGLSSGSYLAVKGITVDNIAKTGVAPIKLRNIGDLVTGKNGLDFTKFQFLIWTLIGMFIYLLHCNDYVNKLYEPGADIQKLMNVDNPLLPTVSWSFIVLMGLSQGAYVGKKLIPESKIEEAKENRNVDLNTSLALLNLEIEGKQKLVDSTSPVTDAGKQQLLQFKTELVELNKKKDLINLEITRNQQIA